MSDQMAVAVKQAIAGVAPVELGEVTNMIVWPTIAATSLGRFLGRLYSIQAGVSIFTVGKLFMGLTIPIALGLFFAMLSPFSSERYRLTNRRVTIQRGWRGTDEQYVDLDRFDSIEVVVQPGQAWYPAGDLVFRKGNTETFRLSGVSRPETFRQTCMKAHLSYVGVKRSM